MSDWEFVKPGDRGPSVGSDRAAASRSSGEAPPELAREGQVEEVAHAAPSIGVLTPGQWKGWLGGSLAGALLGALVLLPIAFVSWANLELGWRVLIAVLIGSVAGGVIGGVYWIGRMPEVRGETTHPDAGPAVEPHDRVPDR